MVEGHREDVVVARIGDDVEELEELGVVVGDEREVAALLDERGVERAVVVDVELGRDAGRLLAHDLVDLLEVRGHGLLQIADAQGSAAVGLEAVHGGDGVVEGVEHTLHVAVERLARGREHDIAAVADEERASQLLFESGDVA